MIEVHFTTAEGEHVTASATPGTRLLEVAQRAGMPLEGTCEGHMACSTCHVILAARWFVKVPVATPDEDDMLDLAAAVTGTSRLSCQIVLTPDLDGIEVVIPAEARDMQGLR